MAPRTPPRRLAHTALAAVAASLALAFLWRAAAFALWPDLPADAPPVEPGAVAAATVVAALGATAAYAFVARRAHRPAPAFLALSGAVLLLSLGGPLFGLEEQVPGATPALKATSLGMHAAVALGSVAAILLVARPGAGGIPAPEASREGRPGKA